MILIAGGGGFVGLNIARCLAERGEQVLLLQRHAIDRHPLLEPYWDSNVEQAVGSVSDLPFIISLIKEFSVESIIHSALPTEFLGGADMDISEGLHQMVEAHVGGSINILEAARLMDLRRISYISSVLAYEGVDDAVTQLSESTPLPSEIDNPMCGIKRATEQLGLLYAGVYGLSVACLRVGWVYGPGSRSGRNPITRMVEDAMAGRPTKLTGIDPGRRAYTVYAEDVGEAAAQIHLAGSLEHAIYNVADGGFASLGEAAGLVKEIIPEAEINFETEDQQLAAERTISMQRLADEFAFRPLPLKDGIAAFIAYMRDGTY
ncbi:MAG: hypothetical protein CMM10_10690 [Rhodospirillaceae bacterium]|jgi:nucleoside-diphosphate-sugar epimerase|nr:hypothetical protein [Rhodospirillaceae bacterium]MDP6644892.1 NAD(P)-dependent oxidoreductase [Rhodospirillales bacterium]|tara:strand:- start:627 stop:1583 length:957 start_codon:yes stop_codon:yes gene_type:complete